MADLLVDTDVFTTTFAGPERCGHARDLIHYSVITRCELFAGAARQEETVRLLLAPFVEVLLDRAIAERAGKIRREWGCSPSTP